MKVGDLVRLQIGLDHGNWIGIITAFRRGYAVVFWNERFPSEEEYMSQLVVIV